LTWRDALQLSGWLALVSVCVFTYGLWWAGGQAAATIRSGGQYSGEVFGGLFALDVQATAFRFTRLPRNHGFDRGCVLYLGRANGKLVLYDTEHDRPLPLDEREYAGQPLPNHAGPPPRCESANDTLTPVLNGGEVEDLDVAAGVRLWAQRGAGAQPWTLLVRIRGRTTMLARSSGPMRPDLGRDARGALVVTYRRCGRGNVCVMRERAISGTRATTVESPQVRGCSPERASRHVRVVAVVLGGRSCPVRARGVWTKREGRPWHRARGSAAASGDLDAYDSDVAWVERRGPLLRLRVSRGGRPATAFEDDAGLAGDTSFVTSVRLARGGVMWSVAPTDRGTTMLLSRRFDREDCRTHGRFPTGRDGSGHLAPEAADVLVATPRGLGMRRGPVSFDSGAQLNPDRGLTARSCPAWPGGQLSARSTSRS
jgi:hypothetical protein